MKKIYHLLGIAGLTLILTTYLASCTSMNLGTLSSTAEAVPTQLISTEPPLSNNTEEDLEPLPTNNSTSTLNLKSFSVDNYVVQPDGYSYTLTITVWESLPKSDSIPIHPQDSSFSISYDPDTDIAIPVRFQLQNTTQGYNLEGLQTSIYLEGISDVNDKEFRDYLWKTKDIDFIADFREGETKIVYQPYVKSDGVGLSSKVGSTSELTVNWRILSPNEMTSGNAFVILHDYCIPAYPAGYPNYLACITINGCISLSGTEIN